MDRGKKNNIKHPREGASLLSIISFSWLLKTFLLGYKREFKESDIYLPLHEYESNYLGDQIVKEWQQEESLAATRRRKPSLLRVFIKCFTKPFIIWGIVQGFFEIVIRISEPILLAKVLSYFSPKKDIEKLEAIYWATGLALSIFIGCIQTHQVTFALMRICLKISVSCSALIYRKILRISLAAIDENTTTGQMVNLLSNDIGRFEHCVFEAHYLWIAPIQIVIITYIIYQNVHWTALIGMFTLLLFFPVHGYFGKKATSAVEKSAYRTDDRLRLMNEIIRGIQTIKMYAWEKHFCSLVEKSRRKETKAIRLFNTLYHLSFSLEMYATRICLFISLSVFVYFGNNITGETVYLMMTFYDILRSSLFISFPLAIQNLVAASVSIKRLEKFMMHEELPESSLKVPHSYANTPDSKNIAVSLKQANAKWSLDSNKFTLKDITFAVEPGKLIAIVGPVGSGKTSLLQTILRELPLLSGSLEVNGKIAYTCQESWIFASSIKQNILFGNIFDEQRYKKVIEICQLKRDLTLFPYGDKTIIGDRGINLSGGQRARISLARAVYAETDIYLLDDPLSAVDTEVGRCIFEQCFNTFLKQKTVFLVTHQIQYLKYVDHILVLNEGKIISEGTFEDLQKSDENFSRHLQATNYEDHGLNKIREVEVDTTVTPVINEDPENVEMRSYGCVSHKVYLLYCKAVENWGLVTLVVFLVVLSKVVVTSVDYFVSLWVNAVEISQNNTLSNAERDWYIMWYSGISVFNVIINTVTVVIVYKVCTRASKNLHKNVFSSIIRSTMHFFNINPSGRIMNRFSKDIGNIDMRLPIVLIDVMEISVYFLLTIGVIAMKNPWLLIPSSFMIVIIYLLRTFYIKTGRSIKRLEAITRSPIFDHLTATVQGLTTIRAFKAQGILSREFDNHQNLHSTAYYIFIASNRACGLYIDLVCWLHLTVALYFFLLMDDIVLPGDVGLVISQSMILLSMVQWGVRQSMELENQMTSVERVLEYMQLEQEPPFESCRENKPAKEWPSKGQIEFRNFTLMYSPDGDAVLKNINIVIMPKEKIGIVGRTGAGKTSLISALFRLAYMKNEIYIDNVPISSIGIHDLRSKISIIPQEPIFFSGSLRKNLDPFDEHSDNYLWQALEDVEMKKFVANLVTGLNTKVYEGGTNYSVGQRQLLCLARTIIKKNKILILDEATANVDLQTDELIQKTIRKKFEDCTVLTIAHRLNTIMDSSRVLVMDAGEVVEFDQPYVLLQKKSGYFYDLVQQTGSALAQTLTKIAKNAYYEKQGDSTSYL